MNEQNVDKLLFDVESIREELEEIRANLEGIKEVVGLIGLLMSKQNETKDNQ